MKKWQKKGGSERPRENASSSAFVSPALPVATSRLTGGASPGA
jgi:hypothetical protein